MADLMTRIAADDSQFQSAIGRIDGRLTGFAATVKRGAGTLKQFFTGFGAAAVIGQVGMLVRNFTELREEIEQNGDALRRATSDGIRGALEQARALSGVRDAYREIGDAQVGRMRLVSDEATKQIMQIGMMNPYQLAQLSIIEGKTPQTILDELVKNANIAQNQIARITPKITQAQKGADAAAEQVKQDQAIERGRSEIQQMLREAQSKYATRRAFAERIAEERVSAMRDGGQEREAAVEANRLRYAKFRNDISESDVLSEEERLIARRALFEREKQSEDAINARFANDAKSAARNGFQTVGVGGTTFAQQLSLTLKDPLQDVVQNTKQSADTLEAIYRKLDRTGPGASYQP